MGRGGGIPHAVLVEGLPLLVRQLGPARHEPQQLGGVVHIEVGDRGGARAQRALHGAEAAGGGHRTTAAPHGGEITKH